MQKTENDGLVINLRSRMESSMDDNFLDSLWRKIRKDCDTHSFTLPIYKSMSVEYWHDTEGIIKHAVQNDTI